MKTFRRAMIVGWLLAVGLATLGAPAAALARGASSSHSSGGGSSGGFSHSSPSSSSRSGWGSSSSSSSHSSWGSSSPSSSTSSGSSSRSGWGSSSSSSGSPAGTHSSGSPGWGSNSLGSSSGSASGSRFSSAASSATSSLSPADRALAQKAQAAGTLFSNREEARQDFTAKYGSTYTTRFATEPPARPDYIPQTTVVEGQPVTVIYNSGYGGYGYNYGGRWRAYDALADAVVLDSLMNRHSYYYTPMPGQRVVAANDRGFASGAATAVILGLIFIAILIVVFVWVGRQAIISGGPGFRPGQSHGGNPGRPSKADWQAPAAPSPKQAGENLYDPDAPEYWQSLKVGTLITLRDELALKDSREKTGTADGINYTVIAVRRIRESRDLGQWVMLRLKGTYREFADQLLWFVAKVVDRTLGLAVYEEMHDIAPGNRREFIDRDDRWLFQAPADPDHINYTELKYSMDIVRSVPGPGGPVDVRFVQKPQGELFGTYTEEPTPSGLGKPMAALAGVVEYSTDQPCDNPHILVVEIGDSSSQTGGSITLMEGGPINSADVQVL